MKFVVDNQYQASNYNDAIKVSAIARVATIFLSLFLNKNLLIGMITVICGTNRPQNATRVFAKHYYHRIIDKQQHAQFLSLDDLPHDFVFNNAVFGVENLSLQQLVEKYIEKAEKLIIVSPEYNGSFPGVLKAFLDSFFPKQIAYKKAALVGVSSGRAGNLRGMDHLTGVLNYLKVTVLPNKLPISQIISLVSDQKIIHPETLRVIDQQIDEFIEF